MRLAKIHMAAPDKKALAAPENGAHTSSLFPVIVSASRSTDIPAFYCDWLFERLEKGHSIWINPFNGKKYHIGYAKTKFIVFWSKNPAPLLKYLDYLDRRDIGCYIHFTLNDYEGERLEPNLPGLDERITTFRTLVKRLGKGAVIWRFDPLVLTDTLNMDSLLAKIRNIGTQLHDDTEKLVFSFVDVMSYRKVRSNLARKRIAHLEWSQDLRCEFALRLVELNKAEGWGLKLASCGEIARLAGIEPNRCIDPSLILRFARAPEVWEFFGAKPCADHRLISPISANAPDSGYGPLPSIRKNNRDRGQRKACACARSKDIGQYATCPHLCEYCYANANREIVLRNYQLHKRNPHAGLITG